jgi:hypothetical protein
MSVYVNATVTGFNVEVGTVETEEHLKTIKGTYDTASSSWSWLSSQGHSLAIESVQAILGRIVLAELVSDEIP